MSKRCTLNPNGTHEVYGSAAKPYMVHIRDAGYHTCTCMSFAMKKNRAGGNVALGNPVTYCKHITALLRNGGCGWNSETGQVAKYPTVCPECDSPTEDYFTASDIPDDDEIELAIAGLLATRERMRT